MGKLSAAIGNPRDRAGVGADEGVSSAPLPPPPRSFSRRFVSLARAPAGGLVTRTPWWDADCAAKGGAAQPAARAPSGPQHPHAGDGPTR